MFTRSGYTLHAARKRCSIAMELLASHPLPFLVPYLSPFLFFVDSPLFVLFRLRSRSRGVPLTLAAFKRVAALFYRAPFDRAHSSSSFPRWLLLIKDLLRFLQSNGFPCCLRRWWRLRREIFRFSSSIEIRRVSLARLMQLPFECYRDYRGLAPTFSLLPVAEA